VNRDAGQNGSRYLKLDCGDKILIKNFPQLAITAGVVLLILSLVWWQQTFGFKLDYIRCFAFSDGSCRVGAIGKIFGGAGYNPIVFWIGLICLGAGLVLKRSRLM